MLRRICSEERRWRRLRNVRRRRSHFERLDRLRRLQKLFVGGVKVAEHRKHVAAEQRFLFDVAQRFERLHDAHAPDVPIDAER